MRTIGAALALVCLLASITTAATTVTDTIYTAANATASGYLIIDFPYACTGPAGRSIETTSKKVTLSSGVFTVELEPNDTCDDTFYEVSYYNKNRSRKKKVWTRYWVVPTSGSPVAIEDIQQSTAPTDPAVTTPISLLSGCSVSGQVPQYNGLSFVCSAVLANPMSAAYDLIRGGSGGELTRFPVGTGFLKGDGAALSWEESAVYNVMNYGALCDGNTDDSTAIDAAIVAAAGKGQVYIPPGRCVYASDTTIELPDDTEIIGSGWNSELVFTSNVPFQYITNVDYTTGTADRIRIRNLTIEGNGDGVPGGATPGPIGILLFSGDDLEISGVRFYRIDGPAIMTRDISRMRVLNNLFFEIGRDVVAAGGGDGRVTTDISIIGNTFYKVGDDAISVYSAGTGDLEGSLTRRVIVSNNTILGWDSAQDESFGKGIRISGVELFTVANNVIDGVSASGIAIEADTEWTTSGLDSNHGTVVGNTIHRSGFYNTHGNPYGIRVTGASYVEITANVISESDYAGIVVNAGTVATEPATFNISIAENIIHNVGDSSAGAVYVNSGEAGQLNNTLIAHNTIYNNAAGGIAVSGGRGTIIESNLIYNNGTNQTGPTDQTSGGIWVRSNGLAGVTATIRNNKITDTRGTKKQTYGVVLATSGAVTAEVVLEGNHLYGNETASLLVATAPTIFKRANNWLDSSVLAFAVYNGLDLEDAGTRPACSSATRGILWVDEGAGGVADTTEVCAKDDGDSYAWTSLVAGAAGGEANTASNLGAGVGVYEQKSSVDLQFNSLVGQAGIDIAEDDGNDEIDITFDATELTGITWSAGGSASFTWTFDVSGTDPVITLGNGIVNVSTGELQEGGSAVLTEGDEGTGNGLDADTVDGQEAAAFAVAAEGVTNGDSHDHEGGDGAQIDHVDLANKGSNTHPQIDTHLGSTSNPHSTTATHVGLGNVEDAAASALYLPLAGGTMTGALVTDNLGIEFQESDTNPPCAAGNYNVFADLSEGTLKKCIDGSATDLDTTGGTPDFGTITGGTNTGATMVVGTGASLGVSGSGTIAATSYSVTAADVGTASPSLDDTDASVEWEDAADLESDGSLSNNVVGPDEMADADHGDGAWSSGVLTVEEVDEAAVTAHEGAIDHDALTNFEADEHVAITESAVGDGELLKYTTDHWENQTLAEAGIQAALSLASGVETFLGTPSSSNLALALTDEVGNAGGFTRGTAGSTDDCVKWDANGNQVSAGAACGAGGSLPSQSGNANTFLSTNATTADWRLFGAGFLVDANHAWVDDTVVAFTANANTWPDAQTFDGGVTLGSAATLNATGADATSPFQSGTTLPSTCLADEEYFTKTDATNGQQLYVCDGDGTSWNLSGDGGGGGGGGTMDVALGVVMGNGSDVLVDGVYHYIEIPFACTITDVVAGADVSGTVTVDIWKDTYANYPPTVADTIVASAPIALSTALKYTDSTLDGWTTSVDAGDWLGFAVNASPSPASITELTVALTCERSDATAGETTEAGLEAQITDVNDIFTDNDGALDDDDVTAADVGTASPSLDDTDASVEWEDAADLESDGSLSNNVVGPDEMADADHGDVAWSSGVATVEAVDAAAVTAHQAALAIAASQLSDQHENTDITADLEEEDHASEHQHGGGDEIASATAGANVIPKAGAGGQLAIGFLASGTPDGTKFVRDDGTLVTPGGSGDITAVGDCASGDCYQSAAQNEIYAGPASGGAGQALIRAMVADDVPDLSSVYEVADAELAGLAGLSGTGVVVKTGAGTFTERTITGTANEVTVTNGNGVSGAPTISLPTGIDAAKIGGGGVSTAEYDRISTVGSNVQDQIDGKQASDAALTVLAAGSDFVDFAGPTTSPKTFTLPDADATLLYSGGALGTPSGGALDNTTAPSEAYTESGWNGDTAPAERDDVRDQFEAEPSATRELTNKTIDAEGTGNDLIIPSYITIPFAVCTDDSTGAATVSLPTGDAPAATCVTTGNGQAKPTLDFDSSTVETIQYAFRLPPNFTGNVDGEVTWYTVATSGDVIFQWESACIAAGEDENPSWNTLQSWSADTADPQTLDWNVATQAGLTMTGCAGDELLMFRFGRDANNGSDTINSNDVAVKELRLTIRNTF